MQPNRLEFQKQCAFQSFCKRALRNEAVNAHKEIKRRRAKEVSFSDLTPQEQDQLCTYDSYFYGGHEDTEPGYYAAGKKITAIFVLLGFHFLVKSSVVICFVHSEHLLQNRNSRLISFENQAAMYVVYSVVKAKRRMQSGGINSYRYYP